MDLKRRERLSSVPRPKRTVARNRLTNAGRPAGGVVAVSWAQVNRLPKHGTVTEFANALEVNRSNVLRWIELHGAPVMNIPERPRRYRPYTLSKLHIIAWLTKTGRYRPGAEYR